jgi:hypothetical protein
MQPIKENGEYVHSVFCSGSRRHPRTPGNTCSCHSYDISLEHFLSKLAIQRQGEDAKRTLWVAECACGNRKEYPHTSEYIPREVWCPDCSAWNPIREISWEGKDLAKLLPVIPR